MLIESASYSGVTWWGQQIINLSAEGKNQWSLTLLIFTHFQVVLDLLETFIQTLKGLSTDEALNVEQLNQIWKLLVQSIKENSDNIIRIFAVIFVVIYYLILWIDEKKAAPHVKRSLERIRSTAVGFLGKRGDFSVGDFVHHSNKNGNIISHRLGGAILRILVKNGHLEKVRDRYRITDAGIQAVDSEKKSTSLKK